MMLISNSRLDEAFGDNYYLAKFQYYTKQRYYGIGHWRLKYAKNCPCL
jgi:hypothetical protein